MTFLDLNIKEKLYIPKKIRIINFIWKLIIFIISIVLVVLGSKISHFKKSISNCEIPPTIEFYANKNEYIIFPQKNITINTEDYLINETQTHYFLIDKKDIKLIVYDRLTSCNSFEVKCDNLLLYDNHQILKEYSNLLNNLYLGSNYDIVCYLINKENIMAVYGLAQKDNKTGKLYISKYVLFNMENGNLLELK